MRLFRAIDVSISFSDDAAGAINDVISQIVENTPGVVPLQKIAPNALIIYGKYIPVHRKLYWLSFRKSSDSNTKLKSVALTLK